MWQQEKLLLIDGFNLLSRSYFATAYNKTEDQLTRNSSGLYTNALRVFFQKMYNLIKQHGMTHIAIAWDVKREETDRRQAHDFYKANRNELPPALIQQYETLTKALDQIGMTQFVIAPHEADDIIGALSHKWSLEKEMPCFIYSNDKDLLQLLNPFTSQIMAQKRQELVYTVEHFEAEYGIQPSQWIDVKALLGDSSDNIPGCPGVGAKSALPLIQQYETIEQLFNQLDVLDTKFNRYKKKLTAGEASAFMSKELVTINRNIPEIEAVNLNELLHEVDEQVVRKTMDELELRIKL